MATPTDTPSVPPDHLELLADALDGRASRVRRAGGENAEFEATRDEHAAACYRAAAARGMIEGYQSIAWIIRDDREAGFAEGADRWRAKLVELERLEREALARHHEAQRGGEGDER